MPSNKINLVIQINYRRDNKNRGGSFLAED